MEKQPRPTPPPQTHQPPSATAQTTLIKRVKVPVNRPVAPMPSSPTMIKVPVQRIKVPVGTPVAPATPSVRPAPPPPRPAPPPEPEEIPVYEQEIIYDLPDDLLDRIDERRTIPEKFFLFYLYARSLAEYNAGNRGYTFPELDIYVPKTLEEAAELVDMIDEEIYEAAWDDLGVFARFIPELDRLLKLKAPFDTIAQKEIARLQHVDEPTLDQKIVMAYLLVMADMQTIAYKLELRKIEEDEEEIIDEIKSIEQEERETKKEIADQIKKRKYPVDAERLVKNYFSLAKKDPDKAFEILTTNPLFFSPIQMEKIPSRFFGLIKPTPKDAIAVNKKLASFLKGLSL